MGGARALVVTGFGLNCERETAYACRLAGAETKIVHFNELLSGNTTLDQTDWILFPGGFSYGDELGAGKGLANKSCSSSLKEQLSLFVASGGFVTGICNGFQFLLKVGLLPFSQSNGPQATLLANDTGRFENRWCKLTAHGNSPYTQGLSDLYLPIRHGEGRFVGNVPEEQIALRYVRNPNGSENSIAGITDETGRILGLMPHPEAFVSPLQHPYWSAEKPTKADGLQLFTNIIQARATAHV